MDAAVEAAQTMFLSLPYHVDVIVDLRESCMPEGNAMLEAARTIPLIPGQNNTLIFVGDPTMSQATYETMRKLYRIRQVREQVHFTPSMDKARALLFKLKPVP